MEALAGDKTLEKGTKRIDNRRKLPSDAFSALLLSHLHTKTQSCEPGWSARPSMPPLDAAASARVPQNPWAGSAAGGGGTENPNCGQAGAPHSLCTWQGKTPCWCRPLLWGFLLRKTDVRRKKKKIKRKKGEDGRLP